MLLPTTYLRICSATNKAATWARVPSRILAARARSFWRLTQETYLARVPAARALRGRSRDRIVPSWNAEEVVRRLPSTKVVTIDDLTCPLH